MYGAQTTFYFLYFCSGFENDVEMYGAQTVPCTECCSVWFENDVEMYGAQTVKQACLSENRLRMM